VLAGGDAARAVDVTATMDPSSSTMPVNNFATPLRSSVGR
jgi:hypothetical protein